jgi:hypothetical protein
MMAEDSQRKKKNENVKLTAEITSFVDSQARCNTNRDAVILDPNFESKLDMITTGADAFVRDHLLIRATKENCITIVDYLLSISHNNTEKTD